MSDDDDSGSFMSDDDLLTSRPKAASSNKRSALRNIVTGNTRSPRTSTTTRRSLVYYGSDDDDDEEEEEEEEEEGVDGEDEDQDEVEIESDDDDDDDEMAEIRRAIKKMEEEDEISDMDEEYQPKRKRKTARKSVAANIPKKRGRPRKADKEKAVPKKAKKTKIKAEKPSKKLKAPPKIKKSLYTKKEKDHATMLIAQRTDLLQCLPSEDCVFLGKHFWIFTAEQLMAVMQNEGNATRQDIIAKLTKSPLLKRKKLIKSFKGEGGSPSKSNDPEKEAASIKLLNMWHNSIGKFRANTSRAQLQVDQRFPLDGPIKCLLPLNTRNFFASAKVKSAWNFLAMKKTETGTICESLQTWRAECGLSELPIQSLAKHLLGVASRMEAALEAIPSLSADTRRWMGDPMCVFTGAAKDFLVDHMKIYTVRDFLDYRTKELASRLETWREKNGMVPLKGSGKVAMISGWKANAKEALTAEVGAGRVIEDMNVEKTEKTKKITGKRGRPPKSPSKSSPTVKKRGPYKKTKINTETEEAISPPTKGGSQKQRKTNKRAEKVSVASLPRGADPIEVLSDETKRFLSHIGINTAEQFLTSRTTDVSAAFIEWRLREGKSELKGVGAVASVSSWKATVRKAAEKLGMADLSSLEPVNKATWTAPHPVTSSSGTAPTPPPVVAPIVLEPPKPKLPPAQTSYRVPKLQMTENILETGGLQGKERIVVAVQRGGCTGQYIFELSLRRHESNSDLKLIATYKGAAPWRSVTSKKKEDLKVADMTEENKESIIPILKDVQVHKTGLLNDGSSDIFCPFLGESSNLGFIDLSVYGLRPFLPQDLTSLKTCLKGFVVDNQFEMPSNEDANPVNVTLHRKGYNDYRYLLCLENTLESGQIVDVRFPMVKAYQAPVEYAESKFRSRHIISDMLQLLATKDLHELLVWLKENILEDLDLEIKNTANSDDSNLRSLYESKRRLSWVAGRIYLSLGDYLSSDERDVGKELYYGCKTLMDEMSTDGRSKKDIMSLVLVEELKEEMESVLDLDCNFRPSHNLDMCRKARDFFYSLRDFLAIHYTTGSSEDTLSVSLKSFLQKELTLEIGNEEIVDDLVQMLPSDDVKVLSLVKEMRQGYLDSVNLSGEEGHEISLPEKLEVIFCKINDELPTEGETLKTIVCRPKDVRKDVKSISVPWYQELLWKVACYGLAAFRCVLDPTELEGFKFDETLSAVKPVSAKAENDVVSLVSYKLSLPYSCVRTLDSLPPSEEFFLGIVWPTLRSLGWRMSVGATPADIAYLPPGFLSQNRKKVAALKKEREQKRTQLAKDLSAMGMGRTQKLTRRLFVSVLTPEGEESEENGVKGSTSSDAIETSGASVMDALFKFFDWAEESLGEGDDNVSSRTKTIVDSVRKCFEEIAPKVVQVNKAIDSEGKQINVEEPSKQGCDVLMKILFILPSILREADLPSQVVNSAMETIQELAAYLSDNYKDFFVAKFHPPVEMYTDEDEEASRSSLIAKLSSFRNQTASAPLLDASSDTSRPNNYNVHSDDLTEVIFEHEKAELSDFMGTVLEQVVPCRATEMDIKRKSRNINPGFPGIVCRHCMGVNGDGRYFFGTVESLTTSYTVLERHFMKCSSCPEEVRRKIKAVKPYHSDQRKALKSGSQAHFFATLWQRLRTSKIAGESSGIYALENPVKASNTVVSKTAAVGEDEVEIEDFNDHRKVLDLVRSSIPLKTNQVVQDALTLYYCCLDYSGRVMYTKSKPEHFSPGWLLAKVVARSAKVADKSKYRGYG